MFPPVHRALAGRAFLITASQDCAQHSTSGKAARGQVTPLTTSHGPSETAFWKPGALELTCTLLKGSDQWRRRPELRMVFIKPQLYGASPGFLAVSYLLLRFGNQLFHWHGGPCVDRTHPTKPASRTNPGGNLSGVNDVIPPQMGKMIFRESHVAQASQIVKVSRCTSWIQISVQLELLYATLLLTDYFMLSNRVICQREKLRHCNDPLPRSMK